MLVFGVNGTGKTTTVAKLAHQLGKEGRSVLLAAADTFRAGASEQLETWAGRLRVPFVGAKSGKGADPAAVAFDAVEAGTARGIDTVLVDTAGRLHTDDRLREELRKVVRVVGKRQPGAPHESLLVLDATIGQNAVQQAREFADAVPLTGLVITKLDSTAKGGSVIALRRADKRIVKRFRTILEQGESPQQALDQLIADRVDPKQATSAVKHGLDGIATRTATASWNSRRLAASRARVGGRMN